MATTQNAATKTAKPAREKKPPVATNVRIIDQLKRGALGGKLSADQLDQIAKLAESLKVFVTPAA